MLSLYLLRPISSGMRHVLLITFCYPPVEIIGSIRPAALAKYLPQFGWRPIVLTTRVEGAGRRSDWVVETEYRDVLKDWKSRLHFNRDRGLHEQLGLPLAKNPNSVPPHTRILNSLKYLLTYPDETKGWIPFALEAVEQIRHEGRDVSAIVTTSPPISCHLIGRRASRILGCPWIADLRDLWTQNLGEGKGQLLQRGLEKRTLRHAAALITVSSPWANRLQRRFPNKKVYSIPNGYDPDDFRSSPPPLTHEFSITYAGQLYEDKRDPSMLFEVLGELVKDGSISKADLRVRFFGPVEPWLTPLISKYGLEQAVQVHGPVPRHMVLERERESQILLVIPWRDLRETGHHSAKLFEYFAASRPVLAIGGSRGVLTQALEETGAGRHTLTKTQLREFLVRAYAEYKQHGCVSYSPNRGAIDQYSHPEMARSFASILDGVVGTQASYCCGASASLKSSAGVTG
jgi:glycosyltransferase involved in cell wall biosynthesis